MTHHINPRESYAHDELTPRVWIGCLACYSAGRLLGEWIEAIKADEVTPEQLHRGPTTHEELWCFDAEGFPTNREMSPCEAAEWGALVDQVDPWRRRALIAWVRSGNYVAEGIGDLASLSDFDERFMGEWVSFSEFAYELFEDSGYVQEMPEHLAPYFDHDAWARDLAYDYDIEAANEGSVYVFRRL